MKKKNPTMKATFFFSNSPVLPPSVSKSRSSLSLPFFPEVRRSQLHAVSGTTQARLGAVASPTP